MSRVSIFWVAVSLISGLAFSSCCIAEKDDGPGQVKGFVERFLIAAREHDTVAMASLVSQSTIERNLVSILASETDDLVRRSVKLVFNAEFTLAAYCRSYILDIDHLDGGFVVHIHLLREGDKPESGPIYRLLLEGEMNDLRVDGIFFVRDSTASGSALDVNVCDVPISWSNPALLKPGESIDEQAIRLGIPHLP